MSWREEIDNSEVFLSWVTDNYLANGECLAQLYYAIDTNKPIILVARVELPLDILMELAKSTAPRKIIHSRGEPSKVIAEEVALFIEKIGGADGLQGSHSGKENGCCCENDW